MSIRRIVARVSSLVLLSAAATAPATADAVSDFYVGKKVTIVVAAGPGGGHTQYSQLLAPYFKKYMTGNPSFVTQNMGGAGGTKGRKLPV